MFVRFVEHFCTIWQPGSASSVFELWQWLGMENTKKLSWCWQTARRV